MGIPALDSGAAVELLGSLLDNIPVAIYLKDPSTLRYVGWNRAHAQLHGIAPEQALGKTADEVFGPDIGALFRRSDDEALARGQLVETRERRYVRPDGREAVTVSRKLPLKDASGRVLYLLGITLDLTERKRLDEALERRAAILKALAYSAAQLLRGAQADSAHAWRIGIESALSQLGEATGVSRVSIAQNEQAPDSDIAARVTHRWTLPEFAVPQDDPLRADPLRYQRDGFGVEALRLRRGEVLRLTPGDLTDTARRRVEPRRLRSWLLAPLKVDSEWRGYIAFDDCVAERTWSEGEVDALAAAASLIGAALAARAGRQQLGTTMHRLRTALEHLKRQSAAIERQNAELAQASRMKSEFLAAVTHELKTPLNGILGFAELLEGEVVGPLGHEQKDITREIGNSGKRLLGLVNRLLELAQLDAGHAELARAHVDVALLLRRLIDELVSNAVKFSAAGTQVTLAAHREPVTGELALEVADTGPGIAADGRARLFQPFGQIDASLTRSHGGVGIGLALVKRIADLHGGRIEVDTAPGEGSRFRVYLPQPAAVPI